MAYQSGTDEKQWINRFSQLASPKDQLGLVCNRK